MSKQSIVVIQRSRFLNRLRRRAYPLAVRLRSDRLVKLFPVRVTCISPWSAQRLDKAVFALTNNLLQAKGHEKRVAAANAQTIKQLRLGFAISAVRGSSANLTATSQLTRPNCRPFICSIWRCSSLAEAGVGWSFMS